MSTYRPGSFFVVDAPGPGGWWIGVAQALAGDASRYKHAGLILDEAGAILEAEPAGARLANIAEYEGAGLLISDAPVLNWAQEWFDQWPGISRVPIPEKRAGIAAEAHLHVGTPYSWLDYAAIAALHLHIPSAALRRYVASSGHMQCAQLVDAVYLAAGIHLFDDGRAPGDVCPADLAAWIEDHGAAS